MLTDVACRPTGIALHHTDDFNNSDQSSKMQKTFLTSFWLVGYWFPMLGCGCLFFTDCGKGLSMGHSRQRCVLVDRDTLPGSKSKSLLGLLDAGPLACWATWMEKGHFSELSVSALKTHGFNAPWNKHRFKKNGEESKCFGRTFFLNPKYLKSVQAILLNSECHLSLPWWWRLRIQTGDSASFCSFAFQKGRDQQQGFQETSFWNPQEVEVLVYLFLLL